MCVGRVRSPGPRGNRGGRGLLKVVNGDEGHQTEVGDGPGRCDPGCVSEVTTGKVWGDLGRRVWDGSNPPARNRVVTYLGPNEASRHERTESLSKPTREGTGSTGTSHGEGDGQANPAMIQARQHGRAGG